METERLRRLLARVRWANVARLLAVAAVALAVVEWARTESVAPALPDAAPRPVVASPPPPPRARQPRGPRARSGAEVGRRAVAERNGRVVEERRVGAGRPRRAEPGRPREAARRGREPVERHGGTERRRREPVERHGGTERRRAAVSAPASAQPRWTPAPAAPPDPVAAEFGAP
jgi:hypothetical protein